MNVGHYTSAVTSSAVMERLKPFDPRVVGTLPLDLAVPGSDIDIAPVFKGALIEVDERLHIGIAPVLVAAGGGQGRFHQAATAS